MAETEADPVAWKFLFAFQSPIRAYFLPVFPEAPTLPYLRGQDFMARVRALAHAGVWEFTWQCGQYVTDRRLPVADLAKVWVFQDCTFEDNRRLSGNLAPVPFSEYVDRFPVAAAPLGPHPDAAPRATHAPTDEFKRWAHQFLQSSPPENKPRMTEGGGDPAEDEDGEALEERGCVVDELLEQAFMELLDTERIAKLESTHMCADFVTKIRGGTWTAINVGKGFDVARGKARDAEVDMWCELQTLPKSGSYDLGYLRRVGRHADGR